MYVTHYATTAADTSCQAAGRFLKNTLERGEGGLLRNLKYLHVNFVGSLIVKNGSHPYLATPKNSNDYDLNAEAKTQPFVY